MLDKTSPVSSSEKEAPERPKKAKLRRAAAAVYESLLLEAEEDDESDSNDETFEGGEVNSSDEENVNGNEDSSNEGNNTNKENYNFITCFVGYLLILIVWMIKSTRSLLSNCYFSISIAVFIFRHLKCLD